jgi:hypothetical protein
MKQPDVEKLLNQRMELIRIIGVLVERLGGEATILMDDLAIDREVSREMIGFGGAILLTSTRP